MKTLYKPTAVCRFCKLALSVRMERKTAHPLFSWCQSCCVWAKRGTNRPTKTFLSKIHIFDIRKRPDACLDPRLGKGKEKTGMRSRKRLLPLTLLGVLVGLTLSACGFRAGTLPAGVPANAQPDTLAITIPSA